MERRFRQVDVFASRPYRGNPVAVVLDGEGLDVTEMRRFAHWTNLSETTFVQPPTLPGADYRLRIFTPEAELPFAGHPTLGSAHAWLESRAPAGAGDERREVVQECGAGLVRIRRDGGRLAFAAPPLVRSGPVEESLVARVAGMLRIGRDAIVDAAWVDNGPGWLGVLLADAESVLRLRPGPVEDLFVGVAGPYPPGSPETLEVRAFVPFNDITVEDPVTGSLNASLAGWLSRTGRVRLPYVARQGAALGRDGRVYLSTDPEGAEPDEALGTLWVGGATVTCVRGTVDL